MASGARSTAPVQGARTAAAAPNANSARLHAAALPAQECRAAATPTQEIHAAVTTSEPSDVDAPKTTRAQVAGGARSAAPVQKVRTAAAVLDVNSTRLHAAASPTQEGRAAATPTQEIHATDVNAPRTTRTQVAEGACSAAPVQEARATAAIPNVNPEKIHEAALPTKESRTVAVTPGPNHVKTAHTQAASGVRSTTPARETCAAVATDNFNLARLCTAASPTQESRTATAASRPTAVNIHKATRTQGTSTTLKTRPGRTARATTTTDNARVTALHERALPVPTQLTHAATAASEPGDVDTPKTTRGRDANITLKTTPV